MIVTSKEWLSFTFEMNDMGEANYILGVKICRDRSKTLLSLSQRTYIKRILERFQMHKCKPIGTPVFRGKLLNLEMSPKTQEEKVKMSRVLYFSDMGSLMYAMMCTRPDICYFVELVSIFQSNLGLAHYNAVTRIFRYLKGTIHYQGEDLRLVGYSDADWGSDLDEYKSMT
jgi:hypothetical protein